MKYVEGISKKFSSLQEMHRRVKDCLEAWHQQQYKIFIAKATLLKSVVINPNF